MLMTTIVVTNQKGGVGKSTTAHALSAYLASLGKKVLSIDLDAQTNLSYLSGVGSSNGSIEDVLMQPSNITSVITKFKSNWDFIPASPTLADISGRLTAVGKEFRLNEALEHVAKKYDFVIIDTPPALSILTINALTAADKIIIPLQADVLSLEALKELAGTIATVKRYTNPDLIVSGIVLTRYNPRSILTRDMTDIISKQCEALGTKLYKSAIREAIAIKEAQATRTDIFSYAPDSKVAKDYAKFIEEFLNDK